MIEMIAYTISGIVLYVFTDNALSFMEKLHGEPLPYRSVIFFVMIFVLAMILFQFIRLWFPAG